MADKPFGLSAKARRTLAPPISYLMAEGVTNPDLISLAAGLVDYESLPVRRFREAVQRLFAADAHGRIALQYGTTEGLLDLRETLLTHLENLEGLNRSELGLTRDNVVVSAGSQQMLFLLTDVLVDPGDIVFNAAPSYFVYTGVLQGAGARVISIPADAGGIRVDLLRKRLEECRARNELGRVKIIYVVSYFDNPTGASIAAQRRPEILQLAREFSTDHRILVIEDAAYRELQYDDVPLPSIKSYDRGNEHVALTMTFSKSFSAGLKIGYTYLPTDLVQPIMDQKGNHDFGSTNVLQHVLADLMASGEYNAHVREVKDAYRRKRDVMLAALDREMAGLAGVSWTRPQGGLYVWATLPEPIDTRRGGRLFRRCIEAGVLYVPGEHCFADTAGDVVPHNHLRLSYGVARPDAIDEGIRRLAVCVRAELAGAGEPVLPASRVKAT